MKYLVCFWKTTKELTKKLHLFLLKAKMCALYPHLVGKKCAVVLHP